MKGWTEWCRTFRRSKRRSDDTLSSMEKRCTGPCGETKPLDAFSKRAKSKDGRQAWCKACVKQRRKEANPNQQRAWKLKHLYGISVEQWDQLLIAQAGRCNICKEPMMNPHLDHSHASGEVRGLLCLRCNTMLGHVERFGMKCIEAHRNSELLLQPSEGFLWEVLYRDFLSSSYN